MRYRDDVLANQLFEALEYFSQEIPLPGVEDRSHKECLVAQLVDSVRRVDFYRVIQLRDISQNRMDPTSGSFDPIRAAVIQKRTGNVEEAFWLAFLSVHFGKNRTSGWNLARGYYGGLGNSRIWNWQTTTSNFDEFKSWTQDNQQALRQIGSFGNHRKYESVKSNTSRGTTSVIESYIGWIGGSHSTKFSEIQGESADTPHELFDTLYNSMSAVRSFGRMAKFDYLTCIGKLGLINIEPGSTYLRGASGPVPGARLLFGGYLNAAISLDDLEELLGLLNGALNLPFGMQVLEDALCNWQKSPSNYRYFNG